MPVFLGSLWCRAAPRTRDQRPGDETRTTRETLLTTGSILSRAIWSPVKVLKDGYGEAKRQATMAR